MARLLVAAPRRWVLKGGVALDFRYSSEARSTRDLDLAWLGTEAEATRDLTAVQFIDLGDYFSFAIERKELPEWIGTRSASYRIDVEVGGHDYTSVVGDIGFDAAIGPVPDIVSAPSFLGFAGIEAVPIPTLPLAYHVAEKVHAYTRHYARGPSSRPKDLVDLIIISSHESIGAHPMGEALHQTFGIRDTHSLPASLPEPPADWATPYGKLAREIHISVSLREGYERASDFLDPILGGSVPDEAYWDPGTREWVP